MAIGAQTRPTALQSLLTEAEQHSAQLKQNMLNAPHFSQTSQSGHKQTRKKGIDENFWQFRPYHAGEPSSEIDWRRSARDDSLYIREKEKETAQTVYLVPDLTESMAYKSQSALCSKEDRALIWCLMLADFFSKNGERVGVPNLLEASFSHNTATRLTKALSSDKTYPKKSGINASFTDISSHAHCIIISDFLEPVQKWQEIFDILIKKHVYISLISIADPAEILFPFQGDTIFYSPNNNQKIYYGQAQNIRSDYIKLYQEHQNKLAEYITNIGGKLLHDQTDVSLQQKIIKLEQFLQHD